MGRRGPPKQPTELKILKGTYQACRDGPLAEQVRPGGTPTIPEGLHDDAKAFWNAVVPGLVAMGVATAVDSFELGEMCKWWERYQRFGKQLDELLDDAGPSAPGAFRVLANAGNAWERFDRIASKFGLTPADRSKLRVEQPSTSPAVTPRKRG